MFNPVDATSIAGRARRRRWEEFLRRFPRIEEMKVLDLGGSPSSWDLAPRRPAHVTTVNLDEHHAAPNGFTCIVGDACNLPDALARQSFDLVYSNSLLEHVGGHLQRKRLADTVHGMADKHWVQTPYRYFPIEPHWVFPGMQFMPMAGRIWVSNHWRYGHIRTSTREEAVREVRGIELIGFRQMREYFSSSEIWVERFAGWPKSLVAVRA